MEHGSCDRCGEGVHVQTDRRCTKTKAMNNLELACNGTSWSTSWFLFANLQKEIPLRTEQRGQAGDQQKGLDNRDVEQAVQTLYAAGGAST